MVNMNKEIIKIYNPWWYKNRLLTKDFKKSKNHKRLKKGTFLIYGTIGTGKELMIQNKIKELLNSGINPNNIIYLPMKLISDYDIIEYLSEFINGKKNLFIFINDIDVYISAYPEKFDRLIKIITSAKNIQQLYLTSNYENVNLYSKKLKNLSLIKLQSLDFFEYSKSQLDKNLLDYLTEQRKLLRGDKFSIEKLFSIISNIYNNKLYVAVLKNLFEEYLKSGGLIENINNYKEEKTFSEMIYDYRSKVDELLKYLNLNISEISNLTSEISNAYGSIYELESMSDDSGNALSIIKKDYKFLQKLGIIKTVYKFDILKGKRSSKYIKTYFIDPFLFRAFIKESDFVRFRGPLVESVLGISLIRRFGKVYFLKDKVEVDFYIKSIDLGIEVKSGAATEKKYQIAFPKQKLILNSRYLRKENNLYLIPYYIFLILL